MSSSQSQQKANYQERRVKVFELRKAGASLRSIAQAVGVSHEQVRKDLAAVFETLGKDQTQKAEDLRALEVERLDMAMLAIAQQVKAGHLGAVDRWVRLMERRAKLLGLDMPDKMALTDPEGQPTKMYVSFSPDEWDGDADPSSTTE